MFSKRLFGLFKTGEKIKNLRFAVRRMEPSEPPIYKGRQELLTSPPYAYGRVDRCKCADVSDVLAASVMCIVGTLFHLYTSDICKRLQFFMFIIDYYSHRR